MATAAGLTLPLVTGTRLAQAAGDNLLAGAVYTLSNAVAGNSVVVFSRRSDGVLSQRGAVLTGGKGTGAGLGSQGAVALSLDGRWVYAVDAGSNTVSVLHVTLSGLEPYQTIDSQGQMPISLTVHHNLLYVLNAGGAGNIAGFSISPKGKLTPLAGSSRGLGGSATGPAQVSFAPDGDTLVVTEKAANMIVTYDVGGDGRPSQPHTHASSGNTPFGFDFAGRDTLVVSEANGNPAGGSAVSSYEVDDGQFRVITPSAPDHQNAACWVVATDSGRFAYTANAASDSISGYRVDARGRISLLDANGVTAFVGAGAHPTDMALSLGSIFLYVLDAPVAGSGRVSGYAVNPANGSLRPLGTFGSMDLSVVGLAAR
jgi:6-phosphogluconolactonase (cycloisomerase 2 family)